MPTCPAPQVSHTQPETWALTISTSIKINYNIPFLQARRDALRVLSGQVLSQSTRERWRKWNDRAIVALEAERRSVLWLGDRHAAPLGLQRRHLHFQLVPVRRGAERVGQQHRVRDKHRVNQRSPMLSVRTATVGWSRAARPRPGALPTSASATCRKTQAAGLGEAELVDASGDAELPTAAVDIRRVSGACEQHSCRTRHCR